MINLSTLGKGKQAAVQSFAAGSQAPKVAGGGAGNRRFGGDSSRRRHRLRRQPRRRHHLLLHGRHERPVEQLPGVRFQPARGDGGRPQPEGGRARACTRAACAYRWQASTTSPSCCSRRRCCTASAPRRRRTRRIAKIVDPLKIEFQTTERQYKVGETIGIRFKLADSATGLPKLGLTDVRSLYFLAPGRQRTEVPVSRDSATACTRPSVRLVRCRCLVRLRRRAVDEDRLRGPAVLFAAGARRQDAGGHRKRRWRPSGSRRWPS